LPSGARISSVDAGRLRRSALALFVFAFIGILFRASNPHAPHDDLHRCQCGDPALDLALTSDCRT
jgi:hypothetical protein